MRTLPRFLSSIAHAADSGMFARAGTHTIGIDWIEIQNHERCDLSPIYLPRYRVRGFRSPAIVRRMPRDDKRRRLLADKPQRCTAAAASCTKRERAIGGIPWHVGADNVRAVWYRASSRVVDLPISRLHAERSLVIHVPFSLFLSFPPFLSGDAGGAGG